jgi:catechol 2,3-dioxygenase-like lactoylglutathione lyase family enzyme
MKVSANHHPGIRVSDIDRSAQFYIDALAGHWQTRPWLMEGPDAEQVMGGLSGVRFKVCHIGFDEGTIELFQFLDPVHDVPELHPAQHGIIHFAFQVDDVPEALRRVEDNGGKRYWPEVRDMALGFQVIYVTDPDGHVLELIDVSILDLVQRLAASDPAIDPSRNPAAA